MGSRRNPARLVIALSVAAVLAIFLLYTSLTGTSPLIGPSELVNHNGTEVTLTGVALGPVDGDATSGGLRFKLRDRSGKASVPVLYRGSVPNMFAPTRELSLKGTLRNGVFVAEPGTMVTKCPSKYTAEKT
jgi:cytochrome c-type biogenesis protein CcmE